MASKKSPFVLPQNISFMTVFETELLNEIKALRAAIERLIGSPNTHAVAETKNEPDKVRLLNSQQAQSSQGTPTNVTRYYFGTPDGSGFEQCNIVSDPDSPKALYVMETSDGKIGRFYPLAKSLSRLKSNAKSFLLPLCELMVTIDELESVATTPDKYGEAVFDGEFWSMTKKCQIG